MKPKPEQIVKDAKKLETDYFAKRNEKLKKRAEIRHGKDKVEVPAAYQKKTHDYHSPALRDEGRGLVALLAADPVPHLPPPAPELQEYTTKGEQFIIAAFQQLEMTYGAVRNKCANGAVYEELGCIYFGMKRDAYADGPQAPGDDATYDERLIFSDKAEAYKKEKGIAAAFDYRFVPRQTIYYKGDIWNPLCVYEVKEVDEEELILTYGLRRGSDGKLHKPVDGEDPTTFPSGWPEDRSNGAAKKMKVVEYWNRDWCMIVAETGDPGWFRRTNPLVLEEWEHNWGRVPYFFRPAFETEELDEEYKFETPLDALFDEIPYYNRQRIIMSAIAYMTGFAPFKLTTDKESEPITDADGKMVSTIEFEPGKFVQFLPGQDGEAIRLSPEVGIVQAETLASESRIRQFSLSPIFEGQSPGADTANSAITNLKRLQRSSMQPMSDNQARQEQQMARFLLERVKGEVGEGIGERVYVYDRNSGTKLDLAPEEIVTMDVQMKVQPDTGTDLLIEEKQAAELVQLGLITEEEFHERRGKENPEEYVKANARERMRRLQEGTIQQIVLATLGDAQAVAQQYAASQETGDANSQNMDIMEQIRAMRAGEPTGMGQGAEMMPRNEAVRSPAVQTTTQPVGGDTFA